MENIIDSEEDNVNIKDRAKLCFVCDNAEINFFYYCGNGLCSECLQLHLQEQINKYKIKVLSEKIKFLCASSCRCEIASDLMLEVMNQTTKALYYDALFRMYISKSDDIIACPKSTCLNSGFITKSNSWISKCYYECPVCNYCWVDDTNSNVIFKTFKTLLDPIHIFSNLKSHCKKISITKYCNNCSAPIEKAEGCKHIECNRCEYSFCWDCTDKWNNHVELSCMGLLTNEYDATYRISCFPILFLIVAILCLLKLLFSFNIFLVLFTLIFKISLFSLMLFLDIFLVYGIFFIYKKRRSFYSAYLVTGIWLIYDTYLYKFEIHPFSEIFFMYCELISLSITSLYGLFIM